MREETDDGEETGDEQADEDTGATNSMSVPALNSGNGVEPSSQVTIGLSDSGLIRPTAIVRQRNADMPTTTSTPKRVSRSCRVDGRRGHRVRLAGA